MKKTLISLTLFIITSLALVARINAQPANYCPGPGNGADNGIYEVLNPGTSTTIYTSAHFAARWTGSPLVPNGRRSFEASDLTGSFFYVFGSAGNVSAVTSSSSTTVKQAATFEIVPGLDTSRLDCVSFRSITNTNQYLRHAGFRIYMNTNNNSALFRADATFCLASGLAGSGASFESLNYPGRFLRRRNLELWVDPEATDAGYKSNATFNVVSP